MSSNPNTTETFALLLSLNATLKRSMLVLFYVILNIGWSQMSTIIPAWEQALDLNFSGNILDLALSKLHFCTCVPSRCVQTGGSFRRSEYEVNREMGMKYICPEWVKLLLHKLCILVIIFPTNLTNGPFLQFVWICHKQAIYQQYKRLLATSHVWMCGCVYVAALAS